MSAYAAALARLPHLGPVRLMRLLRAYSFDTEAAYASSFSGIGLTPAQVAEVCAAREEVVLADEARLLEENGITVLLPNSSAYPERLSEIAAAPAVLFVQGESSVLMQPQLAVVGSRVLSTYGKQVTRDLSRAVARSGVVITSGLARGADGIAHQAALDSGTPTIAVLGSGHGVLYPKEHTKLAKDIVAGGGVVLSEFHPRTRPAPYHFPQRNRIIAGMALGVLITEAREKSGSLITASFALEQGREVLAVPGNVTSVLSVGTNSLIQKGARLVQTASDILTFLGTDLPPPRTHGVYSAEETALLAAMQDAPQELSDLIRLSALSESAALSTLMMLELRGLVESDAGVYRVVQ